MQELATALGNDPNFSTTVLNKIGEKESKTDAQIEYKKLQDAIPTKISQLPNDSGYQKTAEIPVASQTQNGYMSKDDKVKLDRLTGDDTSVINYVKSVTESNGKLTVTKGSGDSTIINLIDTFYPIGTVYISADKTKTKADFPFMTYGTWEEVPANRCLQTGNASEAGTQRNAGLPNITGVLGVISCNNTNRSGAFYSRSTSGNISDQMEWLTTRNDIAFDASRSNHIYGNSTTVQPPSYMVRAWVRTA